MTEFTPLLLAGEVMLASVLLSSAMLYFLYRSRRELKNLQRLLDQRASDSPSVEQFLTRESGATQRMLRLAATPGDQRRLLALLRKRWLQAEQLALVDRGRDSSDIKSLQKSMGVLLKLLEQNRGAVGVEQLEQRLQEHQQAADQVLQQSAVGSEQEQELQESVATTDAELKKARATIDTQRKTIQDLRNLLALYRQRTKAKPGDAADEAAAGIEANLQVVEGHTDALQQAMNVLEQKLSEARENYRHACEQIKTLQAELAAGKQRPLGDAAVLVVEKNKQKQVIDSTRDFLNDMEAAYQQSSSELGRLQDTNRRQRELILQMEKELSLLRKDAVQYEASNTLLNQLKLQLRDYEMCTITLEAETENLRERLQTLNRIIEQAEQATGADMVEQLQREMAGMAQLKTQAQKQQHLLEMLQRVATALEPEQAAAQVLALLHEWQLEAVLFLKAQEEQLWLASSGAVDRRDKQLLQSIAPAADQPWLDTKDGTMLLYPCCRLLLRGPALASNEREQLRTWLLAAIPAFDALMGKLFRLRHSNHRLQQLVQQCKTLRKPLVGIEVQNRYLLEESQRVLGTFRTELTNYFGNIDVTPVQRQILEDMFKDFEARMTLLTSGSGASRKSLQQVMQSIESLTAES